MFLDHSAPFRGNSREIKIFKANGGTHTEKNSNKNKSEKNDTIRVKNYAKIMF